MNTAAAMIHVLDGDRLSLLRDPAAECPRLQKHLGNACREEVATPEALLFNRPYP